MLLSDNPLASSLFESISVPTRTKAQCPIALSTLVCHFYLLRVKESVRLHTGMECTMETSNHACQQHTTTSYEVRCTGRIGDRCFIGNRLPWVTASMSSCTIVTCLPLLSAARVRICTCVNRNGMKKGNLKTRVPATHNYGVQS